MTDGVSTRLEATGEATWPAKPIPSRRRRRNRAAVFARRGGKTVVALVSVVVLVVTWYGWQFVGDPNDGLSTTGVFDDEDMHAVPLDGAIDILLVGMDSRTDEDGNPLPREVLDMLHAGDADGEKQTDTMILVHIPQDGRHAVAISFPRDSWVQISGGFGKHKLNSAFAYAYNEKFRELMQQGVEFRDADRQAKTAGRKNLVSTLETFVGKPGMIDRYAEVNLASFYEVTNALGGIEVCLNAPVHEQKSGVDLPAGRQTVEGVQALAFVRQRYGLEGYDLGRIARQQAFLSGLARKMLSRDVLANPGKLSDVITAVKKSVVLSDNWDLTEFAAQMRGLSGGNIQFQTIPVIGNANIGGADVLRVDPQTVHEFIDQLTADPDDRAAGSVATPPPTSSGGPTTTTVPPSSSSSGSATSSSGSSSGSSSSSITSTTPPITAGDVPCVN